MIDPISRPDRPIWADGVEPRDLNGLIQARIDRRLSRRELVRRAAAMGIAAPVVGVMLAATSDVVGAGPAGSQTGRLALRQETVPATQPTAPAGTPQEGGTLTVATTEEPDTLHPWLTVLVSSGNILSGMMDTLLVYDSTQQLRPALAEGFEIGEDGLTYTFQLRQGVTFHNGDPFTGQDVIDSWKMILNEEFAAIQPAGWNEIAEITSPDPATLVIKTKETYAPFMAVVAAGSASAMICPSREIAKGVESFKQEFGRAPIGTGPFKFVEWKTKEQVVMEKNPDYWGAPAKLVLDKAQQRQPFEGGSPLTTADDHLDRRHRARRRLGSIGLIPRDAGFIQHLQHDVDVGPLAA